MPQLIPVEPPRRNNTGNNNNNGNNGNNNRAATSKMLKVTAFSGRWTPKAGQEALLGGSQLQCSWRLHFNVNERVFATAPHKASHEMDFAECFTTVLHRGEVGILSVELKNLLDVTLASGGVEIAADALNFFAGPLVKSNGTFPQSFFSFVSPFSPHFHLCSLVPRFPIFFSLITFLCHHKQTNKGRRAELIGTGR